MTELTQPISNLETRFIEDEMRQSYLDYAMSVIVSRALPDVRDGLKPVHRRILYAMFDGGYISSKPYKKSSRIVGDVMGKYHPHGDSAIYDAMVRMVQEFSMRVPLVDGQGNFGSMDGDPPAAMRYTEARLNHAAEILLSDIEKETVNFQLNYDETIVEPTVLPASYPNLLVNGATGIAVGMATNIPTHNLSESIDSCLALIDDPTLTSESLMKYMPGPDFPTGGIIIGRRGIQSSYQTGRGSIIIRAKHHMEINNNRDVIVFTEIPYQVNKARLMERIAELVHDKVITDIFEIRDESDRDGVRLVVELKRESISEVVLAQLYKHTALQTSFGVNMIALHKGRPTLMSLRDVICAFIEFRDEIVVRRTRHDLVKARDRAHILCGLLVAIKNLDPILHIIRMSKTPYLAREQLMSHGWPIGDLFSFIHQIVPDFQEHDLYYLSENQVRAILELQLQRLTGMEQQKLIDESKELQVRIAYFLSLLSSPEKRMLVIKEELLNIKEKLSTPRRTEIIHDEEEGVLDFEDLIAREDMVVTVTNAGYVKRVPLSAYRAQRRGGKGRSGMETKGDDAVTELFIASTHDFVLFFSSKGMAYRLKVHQLPQGQPQSRGRAFVNLLPLDTTENITAVLPMSNVQEDGLSLIFVTSRGTVRRNSISDFESIRLNGKIAMKLENDDRLVKVLICQDSQDVLLSTHKNMIIRFPVRDVRIFSGRSSVGVRGISLKKDDYVVSMAILDHGSFSVELRDDYLRAVSAISRLRSAEYSGTKEDKIRDLERSSWLEKEPFLTMREKETFILTVSSHGMGQLCSFYEYRTSGRGGKGVTNMDFGRFSNAEIVASFPVDRDSDVMLVTDAGQVIRLNVKDIRVVSRNSKGVILFNLEKGQRVVSAVPIRKEDDVE